MFSFLRRLIQGSLPSTSNVTDITNGAGTYSVDVVGESNYQKALERICGGRTEQSQRFKTHAFLVPEDNNPFDDKAVCVLIEGETVGHLDRQTARSFRNAMADSGYDGMTARCDAIVVGGWDRGGDNGHFGVKLDLPTK